MAGIDTMHVQDPKEASPGGILDIRELQERFELYVRKHKIAGFDLSFAEIGQPDKLVREHYANELKGMGDAPTWPVCWPASYGLAEYCITCMSVAGKRVLELGCGTAVCGVATAKAGAKYVLATDRDAQALVVAEYNASLNGCANFRTSALDWFGPSPAPEYDLVLGSDVVYLASTYLAILDTAGAALAPGGRLLLSDPGRKQTEEFLELASAHDWTIEKFKTTVHFSEASHEIRIFELTPP